MTDAVKRDRGLLKIDEDESVNGMKITDISVCQVGDIGGIFGFKLSMKKRNSTKTQTRVLPFDMDNRLVLRD